MTACRYVSSATDGTAEREKSPATLLTSKQWHDNSRLHDAISKLPWNMYVRHLQLAPGCLLVPIPGQFFSEIRTPYIAHDSMILVSMGRSFLFLLFFLLDSMGSRQDAKVYMLGRSIYSVEHKTTNGVPSCKRVSSAGRSTGNAIGRRCTYMFRCSGLHVECQIAFAPPLSISILPSHVSFWSWNLHLECLSLSRSMD